MNKKIATLNLVMLMLMSWWECIILSNTLCAYMKLENNNTNSKIWVN